MTRQSHLPSCPVGRASGGLTHPRRIAFAFTLIELMVVVTLMAIAVATVTVRLDGWTTRGRLRSAAHQIGTFHHLAQLEATTSASPRRLVFPPAASHCLLQQPQRTGSYWTWSGGRALHWNDGTVLERLILAEDRLSPEPGDLMAVRIHADGTSPIFACVLTTGPRRAAVLVSGDSAVPKLIFDVDAGSHTISDLLQVNGAR